MGENIFDNLLTRPSLFINKEVMRHSHSPSELPHRDREITAIRFNLVEALKGQIPSNMILYGVTGAGKTAVIRFISSQLEDKGKQIGKTVNPVHVVEDSLDIQLATVQARRLPF